MRYDAVRGNWVEHSPGAKLDYGMNWAEWLNDSPGDSLDSSTWTAPDELTLTSQAITGSVTSVTVDGGVEGKSYTLINRITTQSGLIDSRSLVLVCKQN